MENNNTELMDVTNGMVAVDANGEIIAASPLTGSAILGTIPTTSLADFQTSVYAATPNRFTLASMRKGTTDTLMHIGNQLKSEDVANHVLTIIRVAYASIPATDISGNPVYDENGNQRTATYPVCHFAEAPGYWYNGGAMLKKNIDVWADEVGDDQSDPNLPILNAELATMGGIRAFFAWKNKRDASGQRYMNIILG